MEVLMKKILGNLLLMIILFTTIPVLGNGNIPLRINGVNQSLAVANVLVNNYTLQSTFSPYISGGRTFVPIRELTEGLGAKVQWKNETKSALIQMDGKNIELKIDSPVVLVNGKTQNLNKNAIPRLALYKSSNQTKTMVPLRFLSEALGFDVSWDQETKTAKINGKKAVGLSPTPVVQSETLTKVDEKNQVKKEEQVIATLEEKTVEPRVIFKKVKAQGPITIVLDAGHGGKDSGAIALDQKTTEKELNLMVTTALAPKLRALGYEVIETRTKDEYIALTKRAEIAEKEKAEIFISIHFNSSSSDKPSGIEVLYAPEEDVEIKKEEQIHLAKCILDSVLKETGAKSRGVKARPNLVVLRKTSMPAALAELGFLSNPKELDTILSPGYIDKLVNGIVKGVQNYVANYVE